MTSLFMFLNTNTSIYEYLCIFRRKRKLRIRRLDARQREQADKEDEEAVGSNAGIQILNQVFHTTI